MALAGGQRRAHRHDLAGDEGKTVASATATTIPAPYQAPGMFPTSELVNALEVMLPHEVLQLGAEVTHQTISLEHDPGAHLMMGEGGGLVRGARCC